MLAHTADRALAPAERRRLGQHYTPAPVADLIVAACVRRPGARVFDPACGAGAFLVRAADRLAALGGGGRLLGLELDPAAAALSREALASHPAEVRCADAFAPGELGPVDALVANPPYLELRRAGDAVRRSAIAAAVERAWPGLSLGGRADVYASMLACAAAALDEGGRLGVVTSRAWLDAAYGEALQRFLATRFRLLAVVEPRAEAWFADAAVNPVILLAERARPERGAAVRLACLHRPLRELLAGGWPAADRLVDDLLAGRQPDGVELDEVAQASIAERPGRLGRRLRAPATARELQRLLAPVVAPLHGPPGAALASLRRGLTTQCNPFFYPSAETVERFGIEPSALRPLARRAAGPLLLDPSGLGRVLCASAAAPGKGVQRYVTWAERELDAARALRGQRGPRWYALAEPPAARILLGKAYGERYGQRVAPEPVHADQRLYLVRPHPDVDENVLAALLNTLPAALAVELEGRASLGDGALDLAVRDARRLAVPDPRLLDAAGRGAVLAAFEPLARRSPLPLAAELVQPDRLSFERVAAAALGLEEGVVERAAAVLASLAVERNGRPKLRRRA
jgi:methylase of polypeptide subunit release factors